MARRASFAVTLLTALLAAGSVSGAQRTTVPPVRPLGAAVARAKDSIGGILQLVQLPDGRVVVNDNVRDHLLIFDSSLASAVVVLDTIHTAKRLYPPNSGTALRYRGDSLLFADPVSRAFLVIDSAGNIVRDIAFPPGAAPRIGNGYGYGTRSDVSGHILYWFRVGTPCGDVTTLDSVPLFRADLSVRAVDTVGYARLFKRPCPAPRMEMGMDVSGPPVPIFPRRDEWAFLLDGTIAIVREHDYSIDWIDPDGTHRHTPPVATGWHRLADSDKAAIIDTVRAYYTARADSEYAMIIKSPEYRERSREPAQAVHAGVAPPRVSGSGQTPGLSAHVSKPRPR